MRTRSVVLGLAAVGCLGLCLVALKQVARAQDGTDVQKGSVTATQDDSTNKGQDGSDKSRIRTELGSLLKERAKLDRRIETLRNRLGENGRVIRRFEFRNGDGKPQTFNFDGGDMSKLTPEVRKQVEEALKSAHDALSNLHFEDMHFEDMPRFDFHFDGKNGPDGSPDMKAFQEKMEKWAKEFSSRMERRYKNGPDGLPRDKNNDRKSDKFDKSDKSDKSDKDDDSSTSASKVQSVDA